MERDRYSAVAVMLHWIIAILLVWTVLLAWQAEDLKGAAKMVPLQLHKPLGIVILLLTLARLAWRAVHRPPPLGPGLKPWERRLAHAVHWGFYGLMLLVPLTGWAMVSASSLIVRYPIDMFGLFDWPVIQPLFDLPETVRHDRHELLEEIHKLMAKAIIYGLIPLHVLGALKHQFLDRDNSLSRMIPFLARRQGEAA
ncbi:MAG: cytochrome b [Pseudomonadota bacterium]